VRRTSVILSAAKNLDRWCIEILRCAQNDVHALIRSFRRPVPAAWVVKLGLAAADGFVELAFAVDFAA
jgi:hypothetical protein